MPATTANPEPPGLKSTFPDVSATIPSTPSARPNHCGFVKVVLSQISPITAAHSGVPALINDENPAVNDSAAYANRVNGMAAFVIPTIASGRAAASDGAKPSRMKTNGNKHNAAMPERSPIKANGPNSGAPMRINRNDAPQIAASKKKSMRSRRLKGCLLV